MNQRAFALTLLLIFGSTYKLLPLRPGYSVSLDVKNDPESLLAAGYPLSLACADIAALELLPGVSDNLATALIEKRDEIAASYHTSSLEQSLQIARGVGHKNAVALSRFLSAEDNCEPYETYIRFTPSFK